MKQGLIMNTVNPIRELSHLIPIYRDANDGIKPPFASQNIPPALPVAFSNGVNTCLSSNSLIKLAVPALILCIVFFIYGVSEAAYKIHLKNGGEISEVTDIKESDDIVEVNKNGIMLKLRKASILKIEEYKADLTDETPNAQEQETEQELPEYLKHKKQSYTPAASEQPAQEETQKAEEIKNADAAAASKKDSKISQKQIDSLPSSPQSKKLKDFVKKLPSKAVGP